MIIVVTCRIDAYVDGQNVDPINSYRENGELKCNIRSYLCEYCPTMAMSNGANFQVNLKYHHPISYRC
mgnify:FL=1